jgi:hypothetical protein
MAAGDTYWFVEYLHKVFDSAIPDFGATPNSLKVAFIKSAANGGFDPAVTTPYPTWGSAGSTNLSSSEVTPGGNYSAGGLSVASPTSTVVSNVLQLDWNNPGTIAQSGSNPTNARWAIFYDDTHPDKPCLCWFDLGADSDLTTGESVLTMGTPALSITCTTP